MSEKSNGLLGSIIGAGTGLLGSAISALTAPAAAKRQFKYQQQLNRESYAMAEMNSYNAYKRQRELTKDNALLQLQGLRQAGLSTSFSDGSSVGGASNVQMADTPSPGSAPNVPTLGDSLQQGSSFGSSLVSSLLGASQISNINAQTKRQEIENDFAVQNEITNLKLKVAQTHNEEEKAIYQKQINDLTAKYGDRIKSAEADTAESTSITAANTASSTSIQLKYEDEKQLLMLEQQRTEINNMIKSGNLTEQQIINLRKQLKVMDATISNLRANTRNLDASTRNLDANTTSVENSNKITGDPDYIKSSIREKVLSLIPKSAAEAIMRTKPFMDYVNTLEQGKKLSPQQIAKYRTSLQQVILTTHPNLEAQAVTAVVNSLIGFGEAVVNVQPSKPKSEKELKTQKDYLEFYDSGDDPDYYTIRGYKVPKSYVK